MPVDIGKYASIVLQELNNNQRNPADIIVAWIIGWAYAEPTELLARQITRNVKANLPQDFTQAFQQALQLLVQDQNFRKNALKAFSIAINRYRIREAIKTLAFEGPTDKVYQAIVELRKYIPHQSILGVLQQDIEEIFRIKGVEPPQIQVAPQQTSTPAPTPAQTQPPQPQPPAPVQSQPVMSQTPVPQYPQPQIQPVQRQVSPPQPTPIRPTVPSATQVSDALKEKIETIEKRLEILEDVAASITELTGRIESMEDEFNDFLNELKTNMDELRIYLDALKKELVNSIEAQLEELIKQKQEVIPVGGLKLDKETLEAYKSALELIGVKLDEEKIRQLEQSVAPPEKPGPKPPPGPPPIVEPPPEIAGSSRTKATTQAPTELPPPPSLPPAVPMPPSPPPVPPSAEQIPTTPVTSSTPPKPSEVSVFVTAYGDLKKLMAILKDYRVGVFRWALVLEQDGRKFIVTIQGAELHIPRRLKREIVEKSEILLVVGDVVSKEVNKLVAFARALKKLRGIAWGGFSVPNEIKALGIPVVNGPSETVDDIKALILEVIARLGL